MARPHCRKCNQINNVKLRRQITQSGGTQVFWYCTNCQKKAESKFVSKSEADRLLKPFNKTHIDLPVVDDYRIGGETCAVCGANGAEYHHWLPQCFAEQVENHSAWPASYLCKKCHDVWHELVTPYLPGRGHTPEANYTKRKYITSEQIP